MKPSKKADASPPVQLEDLRHKRYFSRSPEGVATQMFEDPVEGLRYLRTHHKVRWSLWMVGIDAAGRVQQRKLSDIQLPAA